MLLILIGSILIGWGFRTLARLRSGDKPSHQPIKKPETSQPPEKQQQKVIADKKTYLIIEKSVEVEDVTASP